MKLIPDLEPVAAGVNLSNQVKYKNLRNIVQVELKIFYAIMIPHGYQMVRPLVMFNYL